MWYRNLNGRMCHVMLSSRVCHTVKSILHENPRKVMWLFSLSYIKVRRRGQRRWTTRTTTDDDDGQGQRTSRAAADDDDDGRCETAIKPYKFHILGL